jgi:hypothetical protein
MGANRRNRAMTKHEVEIGSAQEKPR